MSTRSAIGIVLPNGKIRAIYCHFDGYPEGVGKTLIESYTTDEKRKALMELGDLSSLGPEIGEEHDFDSRDPAHEGWCRAYGRDRGELDSKALICENKADFAGTFDGADFLYLYTRDGKWIVSGDGRIWCPVTEALSTEDAE